MTPVDGIKNTAATLKAKMFFEEFGFLFLLVLPLPKLSKPKQMQTQHGAAQSVQTRKQQPEAIIFFLFFLFPIGSDDPPPTRLGQLFLLTRIFSLRSWL